MADQWLEAATALDVFGNRLAICERCHAGLVRTQAASFYRVDNVQADAELPREFWWAKGHEALDQNWQTGDFSTWIDQKYHWQAFGVRFALADLLNLLPFDQHAAIRRQLSVAGNSAWISAREARRFAYEKARLNPTTAGKAVAEQCRLGFILARAVEMRWALGRTPDDGWTEEAREWDVPIWFWERFTTQDASSQDWEQGRFAGRGRGPQGYGWLTLNGVHFLRSSFDVLLPSALPAPEGSEQADPRKVALSEADLLRWWDKLAPVREGLTQEQLRAIAASDHPQHTVSRDRIRALADGRKPGPKPN
ncbi:hypothetical protein [Sphingomonas sp. Leaf198]|uniref:hypothetical protein n=1 Tax=Sphingomonas sp. Leaf198 TaxID=1736299 RepID=UPI0006F91452|nr:hypothetical protein [Sphingomonas sp. Leaf198]KQS49732.1 hypothetical protein ASG20_12285 [Sphingomonas sp. Leaf198]